MRQQHPRDRTAPVLGARRRGPAGPDAMDAATVVAATAAPWAEVVAVTEGIRRALLVLARHLPEVETELTPDAARLAITDGSATVEVEMTTPITTGVPIVVYRDTGSGEVYG